MFDESSPPQQQVSATPVPTPRLGTPMKLFLQAMTFLFPCGAFAAVLGLSLYIGAGHGRTGRTLGIVLGGPLALLVSLATLFPLLFLTALTVRFALWSRPFPPVCENGLCRGDDYVNVPVPPEVSGSAYSAAWKCKCGCVYIEGDGPRKNRWLRIMPGGPRPPVP